MLTKRGQGGGAAAGLLAIVALLIVLYVLLLPANVRNQLLSNSSSGSSSSSSEANSPNLLVFAHPGTLDPIQDQSNVIALDSFSLYSEKSAATLKSIPSFHVERGFLQDQIYNLTFSVADLSNTDNYVLAFDVGTSSGRLQIFLNGNNIYDGPIAKGNAPPISIDKSLVQSQNSLIFEVNDPGIAFWQLNEYDLSNVRVIADFTDISKQRYDNSFVVSATQMENFLDTKLTFLPDCLTPSDVSPLSIEINGKSLHYSAIPDCGSLSEIQFDPSYLQQGDNTITFSTTKGNYFVDQVAIQANLKEITYPFYYFTINPSDFANISNENSNYTENVTLDIDFADSDYKQGQLSINGILSDVENSNMSFSEKINQFVQQGENYIQIKPETVLNIVNLNVTLQS